VADLVDIEPLTQSFDVAVEVRLVENLIQSRVERVRGGTWGRRRRLPIAMRGSVVRGIDRVDP
jgi:hypothetical protein